MLGFWTSDAVLIGVQAGLVAGPRPAVPGWIRRFGTSLWATVLPVSLGATIAVLAAAPRAASFYTWLALVAVPLLAVLSLAGLKRGGGVAAWMAGGAVVAAVFVVAWTVPGLAGQGASVCLTALSCAALASFLGEVAPAWTLKVGIVAMAALDSVLVFGQLLQGPNAHLNSAAPGAGLPQLQFAEFGSALVGYGDLFVAAVFGAVLARTVSRRRSLVLAATTLLFSAIFDLLFLVVDVLPATVPVALAVLFGELIAITRMGSASHQRRGHLPAEATTPLVERP